MPRLVVALGGLVALVLCATLLARAPDPVTTPGTFATR